MPEKFESQKSETPEVEREQAPEAVELSGKDLVKLFSSNELKGALKIAGETTAITGRETGFRLAILPNKQLLVGNIVAGSSEAIRYDYQDIIKDAGEDDIESEQHPNIRFHFHPEADGILMPSAGDMEESDLQGVCQIKENGDIDILLLQSENFVSRGELIENIELFHSEVDQKFREGGFLKRTDYMDMELAKILESNGFNNCFIAYKKRNDGYALTRVAMEKIKNFGKVKLTAKN